MSGKKRLAAFVISVALLASASAALAVTVKDGAYADHHKNFTMTTANGGVIQFFWICKKKQMLIHNFNANHPFKPDKDGSFTYKGKADVNNSPNSGKLTVRGKFVSRRKAVGHASGTGCNKIRFVAKYGNPQT
jgi:hypothetical protein